MVFINFGGNLRCLCHIQTVEPAEAAVKPALMP